MARQNVTRPSELPSLLLSMKLALAVKTSSLRCELLSGRVAGVKKVQRERVKSVGSWNETKERTFCGDSR